MPSAAEMLGELPAAVCAVADGVASLATAAGDLSREVPRSEWTAAEAAAHIAVTQSIFANLVRGGSHPFVGFEPGEYARVNASLLEANPQRDPVGLARSIRDATREFLEAANAPPGGDTYESPLGRMPLATLLSYSMCHMLMHGHGLARATRQHSPIVAQHARLAMPFIEHATGFAYAHKRLSGIDASIEFRLRGGQRFWIDFSPQRATVRYRGDGRADCHVVTDPVSFLLVAFDHAAPLGLVLRGQALAWGRRPWLALQLRGLLPGL